MTRHMTATLLSDDPTLDEIRAALAPLVAENAAFDGWNARAVAAAAASAGIDPDLARLACKESAVAMIDAWFDHVDRTMAAALPAETLATMGITRRITELLRARFAILAPQREALRRAIATLAMPHHAADAARLGWRAADRIWRQAGDTATDFNHYTKRMTLSAVYASTVTVFLDDDSEGLADTHAFLDRRIANVMQFEKWKAATRKRALYRPSLARFVGRLRYPRD